MGNIIKINCKKVFNTAVFLDNKKNELESIIADMNSVKNDIKNAWTGIDSENFLINYSNHINSIKNVTSFISYYSDVLKKSSTTHNSIDNDFKEQLKRSGINERKD